MAVNCKMKSIMLWLSITDRLFTLHRLSAMNFFNLLKTDHSIDNGYYGIRSEENMI